MANGLDKWFKQNWVDIRSKKNGMYQPCGRQKGEERSKYPSCRPTASKCNDKGKGKTWGKTK